MSSIDQMLRALPDLFAEMYDEVDPVAFRSNIGKWLRNDQLRSVSTAVANDVRQGRPGAQPAGLWMRVNSADDRQAALFAVLRGLDMAFAEVNPALAGGPPSPGLAGLGLEVATRHRLDSGKH